MSADTGRTLPYVRGVPGAAALGTLALTCGVALTATSGWLIVAASFRPQILTLLAAIVLVRAFGIARPALRYAERVRSHDAALGHLARERESVYRALVPLTPARLGRRARGDVLAGVVDDLDDLAYAQVRVVVPLVSLVGTGLLAAALVALVFVPAALIIAALVLACGLTGLVDWRLESRAQAQIVAARGEVTRWSTLVATQARDIAAAGGEAFVARRLAEAGDRLSAALRRQGRGRAVGVALTPLLTVAATAGVALTLVPWVQQGMPTPIAALIVLVPVALADVVGLVPDAVGALARAQAARRRLDALLDQVPAVAAATSEADEAYEVDEAHAADSVGDTGSMGDSDALDEAAETDDLTTAETIRPTPATAGASPGSAHARPAEVEIAGLTASWSPPRVAVGPVDLRLAPGDAVTITGPNGCGKSTLLAVFARQLDPASGTYLLDGADATALPLEAARARAAVVDDEPHVFASTLRENLRLARPDATDDDLLAALTGAGLGAWAAALPDGLDTRLGAGGQGISGGERARLGLARAVLSGRQLLLLDEPVAHLDHPTAAAVLADLARARADRTTVLVSHREEPLPGAREFRLPAR